MPDRSARHWAMFHLQAAIFFERDIPILPVLFCLGWVEKISNYSDVHPTYDVGYPVFCKPVCICTIAILNIPTYIVMGLKWVVNIQKGFCSRTAYEPTRISKILGLIPRTSVGRCFKPQEAQGDSGHRALKSGK